MVCVAPKAREEPISERLSVLGTHLAFVICICFFPSAICSLAADVSFIGAS